MEAEEWRPGSFTKNFSWGPSSNGLRQLHETIRIGFDGEVRDVSRALFRKRAAATGRPHYIPTNFFLFNAPSPHGDMIVADELVFQAITSRHSARFDRLALFAFIFSYVGRWMGARPYQRRPALWAYHYVSDRVGGDLNWDTSAVTADDIENFVSGDSRYVAEGTRKLSTNLNYLFTVGRLRDFKEPKVERWWVDALFLALDRLIEDRKLDGPEPSELQFRPLLDRSGFALVSGKRSTAKSLAVGHLTRLYTECGARARFSEEAVRERTTVKLPDLQFHLANDTRPAGAVHPTNADILKVIPRACAMLAAYAGFDVLDPSELEDFDPKEFIRKRTEAAIAKLHRDNVIPNMSAEDLMKLTRGEA